MCTLKKITGLKRIKNAFRYSIDGLKTTYENEPAFRQELLFIVPSSLALLFLPFSLTVTMILLCGNALILVVELINSSIEEAVNLSSPSYNQHAKNSKDMASSAVFLAIVLNAILWAMAVFNLY